VLVKILQSGVALSPNN